MKNRLSAEVKFVLKFYGFNLILLSIFRFLFLAKFWNEIKIEPASQILILLLSGLRLDISIVSNAFVPIFAFMLIPFLREKKAWKYFVASLCVFATATYFLILVADVIYYETQRRKLGYEVFDYLSPGFGTIFETAFRDHAILVSSTLAAIVLFGITFYRGLKKSDYITKNICSPKMALASFLIAVPIAVVSIRGGFQRVPIRVGDQLISRNQTVNDAVASSPFLAIRSIFDRNLQRIHLMDSEQAIAQTQALISIKQSDLINPEYPIFRKRRECGKGTKPRYNVVVMLLESWTGKYIGPLGDKLNVTPEFNAIAKDGLFFDRFFAEGYRTTAGFFTTLTGIPDQIDRSVLRRLESQNRFGSFSTLLKARGYELLFVHGGLLDFDNMQSFLKKESFDTIIGKQHLMDSGGVERTWGFDDQFTLRRAHEEFSKAKSPFFALTLTVSTHTPYMLPDNVELHYSQDKTPDWKFLNAYRYADWSMGEFFRMAKKAPYFNNTIFVLVADHTHHQFIDNKYDDQHIPFLIYAPGIVKPGVRHTIGSHSDIVPTLAGLLDLPYLASMGRDLIAVPENDGFAFFIDSDKIGWINDEHLAHMSTQGKKIEIYDYNKADFKTDLASSKPEVAKDLKLKVSSWFQTSFDLIKKNKVLPRDFDLKTCE